MNKKQIITTSLVLAGALFTSNSAYAEVGTKEINEVIEVTEVDTEQTGGLTPDDFFYFLDKVGENIKLLFTTNAEKEAELLLQFLNERLAESQDMVVEEKEEYIGQLVEDYLQTLQKAQEQVAKVITDEDVEDALKDVLVTELENSTTVSEKVTEKVDEDQKVELDEKRQEAYVVANVVKGMDSEKVKDLRDQGFGFGEIAKIVSFAEESGKTEAEIVAMLTEGKGYGEVAKELNIKPFEIMKKVFKKKEQDLEQKLEQARESKDEDAIETISTLLASIEVKKTDFKITEEYAELGEKIIEGINEIEKRFAAGEITRYEADQIINVLKKEAGEELEELNREASEEQEENEQEDEENEDTPLDKEASEIATAKIKEAKEKAKEERKNQKKVEKENRELEKKAAKKDREQAKAAREAEKDLEEQEREEAKEKRENQKELDEDRKEEAKEKRENQKESAKDKKEEGKEKAKEKRGKKDDQEKENDSEEEEEKDDDEE